jgi:hypothetical protein
MDGGVQWSCRNFFSNAMDVAKNDATILQKENYGNRRISKRHSMISHLLFFFGEEGNRRGIEIDKPQLGRSRGPNLRLCFVSVLVIPILIGIMVCRSSNRNCLCIPCSTGSFREQRKYIIKSEYWEDIQQVIQDAIVK